MFMPRFMFRLLFVFLFVGFYAHLYVHFIVNPNNELSTLIELSKEDISTKVYAKLPFLMDGKDMSSTSLLEPYVRFVSDRKTYLQKKWTETHDACRTFYKVEKGKYEVTCVHPKYKDLVEHKKLLKQNTKVLRFTLEEGTILFVPNYWVVLFKGEGKVERIQYFTPLNRVSMAISKIFK